MEDKFVTRRIAEIEHMNDNWGSKYGQYPEYDWEGYTELVEPVLALLSSSERSRTKRRAAKVLGWIGDERALEPLTGLARSAPDPDVRTAAVFGLRSLGLHGVRAVPVLQELVETDPDEDVRWQAARALGIVDWPEKPTYARTLLLEAETDRVWTGFVTKVASSSEHADAIATVVDAFGEGTCRQARAVVARSHLANSLQGDSVIRDALKSSDPTVRLAAVDGVRQRREPIFAAELERVAREDDDSSVRAAATTALGVVLRSGAEGNFVDRLASFVDDECADVRRAATHQLRFGPVPETLVPLFEALKDSDSDVRGVACWSLKALGHAGAVPELLEACEDDAAIVRERALLALERIGRDTGQSNSADFDLLASTTVPPTPTHGRRSTDPARIRRVLRAALDDPNANVRAQATRVLRRSVVGETGSDILLEYLREGSDDDTRGLAAMRLCSYPGDTVRDAIRTAAADDRPRVRELTVRGLDRANEDVAVDLLVDALSDPHPDVRRVAAEVADRIDDDRLESALERQSTRESCEEVEYAIAKALGTFDH